MESSSSLSCSDLFGHDGSAIPMPNSLKTYKIIGDNLDKNVKPSARDMRSDHDKIITLLSCLCCSRSN